MALRAFEDFFPSGRGLVSGQKLSNIFRGVTLIPKMAITSLTLGSQTAKVDASQSIALAVTAVTNTDLTATLPVGAIIRSMTVYTTTAFGAVTDAVISVGNAAAGAQYVAAVSIKAAGVVGLTFVSAASAAFLSFPTGSPNLFIRIAQSGGNSAIGAATLVVTYSVP